jgi:hypothetical protein
MASSNVLSFQGSRVRGGALLMLPRVFFGNDGALIVAHHAH